MMLFFSALALVGGCNPNDFQAALDRAPVQFIGAPNNFGSNVGRTLLPLAPPAGIWVLYCSMKNATSVRSRSIVSAGLARKPAISPHRSRRPGRPL
jgi:hypothetical protein